MVEFNNERYPSIDEDGTPIPYLFHVRGNYAIAVDFWGNAPSFYTELDNFVV